MERGFTSLYQDKLHHKSESNFIATKNATHVRHVMRFGAALAKLINSARTENFHTRRCFCSSLIPEEKTFGCYIEASHERTNCLQTLSSHENPRWSLRQWWTSWSFIKARHELAEPLITLIPETKENWAVKASAGCHARLCWVERSKRISLSKCAPRVKLFCRPRGAEHQVTALNIIGRLEWHKQCDTCALLMFMISLRGDE